MYHLPSSFGILTQQGKVKVLRPDANAAAFEELYTLWQDPSHTTEEMEAAVKAYLGQAQQEDPLSITVSDPRRTTFLLRVASAARQLSSGHRRR